MPPARPVRRLDLDDLDSMCRAAAFRPGIAWLCISRSIRAANRIESRAPRFSRSADARGVRGYPSTVAVGRQSAASIRAARHPFLPSVAPEDAETHRLPKPSLDKIAEAEEHRVRVLEGSGLPGGRRSGMVAASSAPVALNKEVHIMAKHGFKMIDAEMHVMEPVDLWERYIAPEFKARAPRRLSERRWDIRTVVEGEVMASMPGGDWPALTDAEEKALGDRYAEEIARNFDPKTQVRAMDKEGLDLAILYPTSAMYITAFDTMEP